MAKNFGLKQLENGIYKSVYDSLKIFINATTGEYRIWGSIWIYSRGNNTGQFSLNEFRETIKELDSLTFGTFSKSEIVRLEYGFNIETKFSPEDYLMLFEAIEENRRTKKLFPAYRKKKIWKRETQDSYFIFKIYNKSFQASLENINVLRIERIIKNVKSGLKRRLFIENLLEKQWITECLSTLQSNIESIILNNEISQLDPNHCHTIIEAYRFLALSCRSTHELVDLIKKSPFKRSTADKEISKIKTMHLAYPQRSIDMKEEVCKKSKEQIEKLLADL
jgi:hypothetical protein